MINLFQLKDAFSLFRYYRLKTSFSLISVVIGIGAIVTLTSIHFSVDMHARHVLQRYTQARFNVYLGEINTKAQNEINSKVKLDGGNWASLSQDVLVLPYSQKTTKIRYHNHILSIPVVFLDTQLTQRMSWEIGHGRGFNALDSNQKVTVVGHGIAEKLKSIFKKDPLGEQISIDGVYFSIIGVFKANEFDPLLDFDSNQVIYLDLPWMFRNGESKNLDTFLVISDHDLKEAQTQTRTLFNHKWGIQNLYIKDTQRYYEVLIQQMKLTLKILWIVAIITLSLGFISILNLLLILLEERKGEIGLRLALGATPFNIGLQFLRETLILNWVGAGLGFVFGETLTYFLIRQMQIPFYFSLYAVLLAMIVSTVFGLVLGAIPARLAIRKKPYELLRA